MRDPGDFHLDLPAGACPAPFSLPEKIHRRAWAAARQCTAPRPDDPALSIRAVVIHATAGSSTDGAVSVMEEARASFHWLVPDENEHAHGSFVWASAPEARACWHVRNSCFHRHVCHGARRINDWSLGVEIVNAQSGGDAFSDWQVRITAEIVRYAWAKYPNLAHVVSHARLDPKRRTDPGPHFPWEAFKRLTFKDVR